MNGSLQYENEPGRPVVQGLSITGKLNSSTLLVDALGYRAEIHDLDAAYFLQQGNARVENLRARILGGTFDGSLDVRDVTGTNQGRFSATLKGISLDQLETVSHSKILQQSLLTGAFAADTQASWSGDLRNLTAHSDLTIQAKVGRPATPLDGAFHADYAAATKEISLRRSYLHTPQTSIELNGTVSRKSKLQVEMQSHDLHELEVLVNGFRQPLHGEKPAQIGLYGNASFTGSVSGVITSPQILGQIDVRNLKLEGSRWDLFHAGIRADPSLLSLNDARLVSKKLGRFDFNLQTGLEKWAYTKTSPIRISASASHVSVKDLLQLAGRHYPVSGTLTLEIQVSGTQLSPVGHGNMRLTDAMISGQPVRSMVASFQGNSSSVHANLALRMKAGAAQAKVTYAPKSETYEGELEANNIPLEQLKVLEKHNLQLRGKVNLNASGKGTLESPQLVAALEIPELRVRQQTIRGVKLQAKMQNDVADISFNAEAAQADFSGHGSVGIKAPYRANFTLDSGNIALEPLLAIYAPKEKNLSGRTELHLTVSGPLAEKNKMEAHLQVPVLKVDYKQLKFSAAEPLSIDYKNGEAILQPASIQGTGTHLTLQAKIPIAHPMKSTFQVQGTADLAIVSLFHPTLKTTGRLQIDIHSTESTGAISYSGVIKLVNASLETSNSPWTLTNANGEFTITGDRLRIETFQTDAGEGSISATGEISYRPAVQFNLAVNAEGLRLVYPDGIRSGLTANLALTGTTKSSTLSGLVTVTDVSFLPDFNLSNFTSKFETGLSSPEASRFERNLHLNVTIQSVSQINLESSKISIYGSLNVRAGGTFAAPVLLGRMALTAGDVFFGGNRYLIQSGTIDFLNPVRIEPVVNLRLQTTVNQYNLALNIYGPTNRLRLSYSSDPALPPADIINLLAFGTTTEATTTPASGTLGAEMLLAKGVSSVASTRIEKFAGLSHFSINPALGGDDQNPGARIAIQERVTSNLYVTYATDVTSTQRQAIELKYQINRRWSVSAVRDQNGGLGADIYYRKSF